MTSDPPGWNSVDPTAGSLASVLPDPPTAGEILVFASSASEDDRNWAADTVAGAIREWAGAVDRLFVMDLDLEGPGIEDSLGAERAEGVSDFLVFGASLSRVVQTLEGGTVQFVPAGTPVASARVLLAHERWEAVIRSFRRAEVPLVLFLPSAQAGAASILARADRVVRLGRPGVGEDEFPAGARKRIDTFLAPPDADLEAVRSGEEALEAETEDAGEQGAEWGVESGAEGAFGGESGGSEDAFEVDVGFSDELDPGESARSSSVEPEAGSVVDIADLAPDELPTEAWAGASSGPSSAETGSELRASGSELVEEAWASSVVDVGGLESDERVVDIQDLAPDTSVETVDSGPRLPGPVVDIADLAPDGMETGTGVDRGPAVEAWKALDDDGPEGLVVDIADLAPDEPVGAAPGPEEGGGILSDEADEADEVSPPASRSVDEEESLLDAAEFEPESFAAGLDAIDAAAEAGKQPGLSEFDLDEIDALSGSAGDVEESDPGESEPGETGAFEELGTGVGETADLEEGISEEEESGSEPVAAGSSVDPEGFDMEPSPEEPVEGATTEEDGEVPGAEGEWLEPGDVGQGTPGATEAEDEEEALAFGGFTGELDLIDEAEPDVPEEEDAGAAPDAPGPEGSVEAPTGTGREDDFGAGLVTGPDFGQAAPDSESDEIWGETEEEDALAGEEATEADASPGTRPPGESRPRDAVGEAEESTAPAPGESEGRPREREAPLVGVGTGGDRERDRTRGRPLRLLALLVLLAGGVVTAHWFDAIDVPGLDRVLTSVLGPARTGAAPTVTTTGPQPASPIQTRSLLVDVYRDAQSAADVALALRERLPDRIFAVSPVQADGEVTFRLLAGPANTASEASDLRQTLAEVLTREDPSGWTEEQTSLAFLVDQADDLDAALARADAVSGDGVFAYVLRVVYPDGSTAHRVYSGAYATPEEARALQGILAQAGIDNATFTERRGEVPE